MLQAAHPDPEPLPVQREGGRHEDGSIQLAIKPEFVDLILARQPPPGEFRQAGQPEPPGSGTCRPAVGHGPAQPPLLLVSALNARLAQQLAVLLLRHPLAPLLDN
jgi:hypothetical protein